MNIFESTCVFYLSVIISVSCPIIAILITRYVDQNTYFEASSPVDYYDNEDI